VRIGCGIVTLYDLAMRCLHIDFYTDVGTCPRDLFLSGSGGGMARLRTVYSLVGSSAGVGALFALHALFAIGMIVGYRTRLMTAACLVMTWSLIDRNLMVMTGGDELLAWLLVWSLFLPMSRVASIDSLSGHAVEIDPDLKRRPVWSIATVALLLQVILVYLMTLAARTTRDWWLDFSALHYLFNSMLATPLGHKLGQRTGLTMLMTMTTMYLELVGPIVALVSWRAPRVRTLIVIAFILLHIGMAMTVYVGSFALVCIVAWLAFVPRQTWDWIFSSRAGAAVARLWNGMLAGVARQSPVAASGPVTPMASDRAHRIGTAAVVAMLAYVLVVNIVGVLPARVVGPLARLPKFKQSWHLLGQPAHVSQLLEMTTTLADGSERVIASSAETGNGPRELIWPSADARERKYWHNLWLLPVENPIGNGTERYYEIFRTRWDQTHPAGERIARLVVVWHAVEIPSIDLVDRQNPARADQQLIVYEWPPASTR
jgi:hypothetical protein